MRRWIILPIWLVSLLVPATTGLDAANPSVPSQGPLPLAPIGQPISLSITPGELSGSASMRPGTYIMDEPLRLQVTSSNPGWYVQIEATSLKGPGDEIGPENIHIETEQEAAALDQPQVVLQGGDLGETVVEAIIELRTTQRHKPGTYVGQFLLTAGYIGEPPAEVITVPFEVEVTCSVSGSISGNKMYFHYGLPGKGLNAFAEGEISADTDVYLSLSVERGRIDCLPMTKHISGRSLSGDSFIPLLWELQENGKGWREPDRISFDATEVSWQLTADVEKIFYELQCSPQPDAAQAPGDYAMCVVLTMAPAL